jgi:hypothetical protein
MPNQAWLVKHLVFYVIFFDAGVFAELADGDELPLLFA